MVCMILQQSGHVRIAKEQISPSCLTLGSRWFKFLNSSPAAGEAMPPALVKSTLPCFQFLQRRNIAHRFHAVFYHMEIHRLQSPEEPWLYCMYSGPPAPIHDRPRSPHHKLQLKKALTTSVRLNRHTWRGLQPGLWLSMCMGSAPDHVHGDCGLETAAAHVYWYHTSN